MVEQSMVANFLINQHMIKWRTCHSMENVLVSQNNCLATACLTGNLFWLAATDSDSHRY